MEILLDTLSKVGVQQGLLGLAVLFVGLLCVRFIMQLVQKTIQKVHAIDRSLHAMLLAAVRFTLMFFVVLTAASTMGIPITSFVALLSVVSLAISLAIQGVLGNLAGGIIILASKPFKLGDYIETESIAGTVKEIGILHTRLAAFDGKIVFVPNNLLYTSRIINHSSNKVRRVEIDVSASYNNSPAQVRGACLDAITGTVGVQADPPPQIIVVSYGDNAINYRILCWSSWEKYYDVKFLITEKLYDTFKKHGVEMTYPHINVHMN